MLGNIVLGSYIYGNHTSVYSFADVEADLSQSSARLRIRAKGVISIFPAAPRLVELDYFFFVNKLSNFPGIKIGSYGKFDQWGTTIQAGFGIATYADWIANELYFSPYAPLGIKSKSDFSIYQTNRNLLKWSNIGSLNFEILRDNVAGERYLDWAGWVHCVKKLGKKIMVYGQNGVTVLHPADVHFGIETLLRYGLKSKLAICGSDTEHFFIDANDNLWKVSEKLESLGYSEHLSVLTNPVMTFDFLNDLIYICDGTYGFVYSTKDDSLCKGPVNISGFGAQSGSTFMVSPESISVPNFEICTDIHDFGSRKNKTIISMEIGSDLINLLEASVDYKVINNADFVNIGWFPVTISGIAYTPCFGQDFRFRVRSNTFQSFELDYIKVNGVIHNYSHLDYLQRGEE